MKAHKSEHSTHAAAQSVNHFAPVWKNSVTGAMEKSASLIGRNVRTLQQESVRFVTRRIQDNLKAAERFGACRSIPDLLATQQKWFADMAHAYSEEWTRCSELMTEALHDDERAASSNRQGKPPHAH